MCLIRDSSHLKVVRSLIVPGRGLEPPWVTPLAPKASASTISPSRHDAQCAPTIVRPVGIEPTTNRLRGECSTS